MAVSGAVVLMGFADAFAAVETAWSLQRAGMRVLAVEREGRRSALRRVRDVEVVPITAPETDTARSRADLERVIRSRGPDAVLPLDDAALWLASGADLAGAVFVGPSAAGAALALDKGAQLRAAAAAGLAVPATQTVDERDVATDANWPVVVKSSAAVTEVDGRLVRPGGAIFADAEECDRGRGRLQGTLLRQPLISGTGEGVFGYIDERGPAVLSAHRRVRMVNPHGSASSACASIDVDPALVEPITRLLTSIGWRGMFMIEFLRDDAGVPWFMEVNGRAWGSMALARRRGLEYPAWATQFALGEARTPAAPSAPPQVVARHLGRELAHLVFVLRGPQSHAVAAWPSPWATVRDLLTVRRGDRLYNWSAGQPGVLVADTVGTLTGLLTGRRRRA